MNIIQTLVFLPLVVPAR